MREHEEDTISITLVAAVIFAPAATTTIATTAVTPATTVMSN